MNEVASIKEYSADLVSATPSLLLDGRLVLLSGRASELAAAVAVLTGCLVLLSWEMGVTVLGRVLPDLAMMKVNSALAFVAAGLSLWLLRSEKSARRVRLAGLVCAGIAVSVGTLTLSGYWFGRDLGIDQLLVWEGVVTAGSLDPGRMAPVTAFNFLLLGLALLLMDFRSRRGNGPAPLLALLVAIVSLLSIIGHAYGTAHMYSFANSTPVAMLTPAAFIVLCGGILLARPDREPVATLLSDSLGGMMARRLLSTLIVTLVLIDVLRLAAGRMGFVGVGFGVALLITASIVVTSALVLSSSTTIGRIDAERRQSEAKYRGIVEAANEGIWVLDQDMRITMVNPRMAEILGYEQGELLGHHKCEFVFAEDVAEIKALFVQRREGLSDHVDVRFRGKDGGALWTIMAARPVRDAAGRFRGALDLFTDITQRKEADAKIEQLNTEQKHASDALRISEERFRGAFDSAAVGVALVALDGRWLQVNVSLCRILGHSHCELLGHYFHEFTDPQDHESDLELNRRFLAAEIGSYAMERRYVRGNGQIVWVMANASVVRDAKGAPLHFVVQLEDTTARRRLEEELRRARDDAMAATRAKSDFLANMSHEIRTPMNGILGMTELVTDTPLSPTQHEYIGDVKSSADALMTVINDILDFSKIEAGKLELDPVPFRLYDCLEETLRVLAPSVHAKGLELILRIDPDVPDAPVGDPGRLRQVLVNLIGNACKFTHSGEVVLAVKAHRPADGDANEGVVLHFAVSDTGVGIRPEAAASIFDPFVQADGLTTRRFGRTGLGLTISRTLVALMGGTIWVESEEGRGSSFQFTSRFERQGDAGPAPLAHGADRLRGLPVLIVDDNLTCSRLIEETLLSWGARPTAVDGGPAALAAVREASGRGELFAVLLIDASMPGMGGFTLVERLGDDPSLRGNVVMMLTSHSLPSDVARCQQLGIAAHLTKPIRQRELRDTLLTVLGASPADKPPLPRIDGDPQASHGAPKHLKILVADDNAFNRKVATVMLQKMGHAVVVAIDGKAALATLAHESFDLVLMDVQMPEMDGLEATAAIRGAEQASGDHLPIIALTAFAMKGDRERFLAAGFDAWVPKPIQSVDLSFAIERLLARAVQLVGSGVLPIDRQRETER
jgi:two-component system, sensor histidine kinase and response regulator